MSFGFSITDLKEAISLSWRLYTSLKDAPQEIKDLAKDLATVYGVLNHIQDDVEAAESAIISHGEDRLRMLQSMIGGLKSTLCEIQGIVDKFRPMAAGKAMPEQLWIKVKWVVGQRKLKRVRQDISFHISSFTLLMTSMGNSSLRRIEDGLADMRLTATEQMAQDNEKESSLPGPKEPREGGGDSVPIASFESTPRIHLASNTTTGEPGTGIPSWLVPADSLPIPEFRAKIQQLDDTSTSCLIDIVFTNCRAACFHFYKTNALWRTRYKSMDTYLFELDGKPLWEPNCLSIPDWLAKISHLFNAKLNEPDSITTGSIYDWPGYCAVYATFPTIPSIRDPWGHVDADQFGDGLVSAIQLCRHFQAWDAFGRLKGFWGNLHQWVRSTDESVSLDFEKWMDPHGRLGFAGSPLTNEKTISITKYDFKDKSQIRKHVIEYRQEEDEEREWDA